MRVECGQMWLDADNALHQCVKSWGHQDGTHKDWRDVQWSQPWFNLGSDLYSPTREPGADDG